jgi:endonuclease YncB( thermonuclease family)
MRATEKHLRSLFAAVIAAGWLGIVGLLAFVFPASNRYTGRVMAISEVAQVMVLRDGRPQSLRLAEVSFPEKGHPHARTARAFANRLALGRDVAVEEARLSDGSRMAYVTLPDGRSLSAELVRAGLAWPSPKHAGRLASSLVVQQTRAMSDRRGLWAETAMSNLSRRAPAVRVSRSVDGLPSAVDADADEIEGASVADGNAATDVGASLGEN